ncbi:MAG: ATP phosphoribosyltransferase regulatory subunit [Dehalococcoidia bacterium]|nr:ATP phosphoribosyltransferase regulatory subunit [Dehalococcoidia bacterium]
MQIDNLDSSWRSEGMNDIDPLEMVNFRRVEEIFLSLVRSHEYQEIRTPTIEPLHLYTATRVLSPQLLHRIYSFLDWDGWSGERVVMRPDSTVPAARLFSESEHKISRLCYVQPVYRFSTDEQPRELWQCGVELFGVSAVHADVELLSLLLELLEKVGIKKDRYHIDVSHAGLVQVILSNTGMSLEDQRRLYEVVLRGEKVSKEEFSIHDDAVYSSIDLLSQIKGKSSEYALNLQSLLKNSNSDIERSVIELESVSKILSDAAVNFNILPGTTANFDYYTGVTFRVVIQDTECVSGGRYDLLTESLGAEKSPASGFAVDLMKLAQLSNFGG